MTGLADHTVAYVARPIVGQDVVFEYGTKTNGTAVLYTVPEGKKLILTSVEVSGLNQEDKYHHGYLLLRDGDDANQYAWWIALPVKAYHTIVQSFPWPLEIVEGWYFKLESYDALFTIFGGITGYLV